MKYPRFHLQDMTIVIDNQPSLLMYHFTQTHHISMNHLIASQRQLTHPQSQQPLAPTIILHIARFQFPHQVLIYVLHI